jgi:hypothetical protein
MIGTILGSRDFVVIVRRWRKRGPVRRPGVWAPASVVDDERLAEAMAELLREDTADIEVRVVSAYELRHKIHADDREHVLNELRDRTTSAIQRDLALRTAAGARLAKRERERRSGHDRRSGHERRCRADLRPPRGERRAGVDRRSGRDRRDVRPAA